MTKSELESFISVLNDAGVEEYSFRCEGANRVCINNGTSGVISLQGDAAYVFEVDDNMYGKQGPFLIRKVPYTDEISSIQSRGLTVEQAVAIAKALGIADASDKEDPIMKIIAARGDNVKNVPSLAGFGDVKDKNGKDVLAGMAGRITTGASH